MMVVVMMVTLMIRVRLSVVTSSVMYEQCPVQVLALHALCIVN